MLHRPFKRQSKSEGLAYKDAFSYATLAFSLAFLALPLYMVLPNYYSKNLQISLSVVGFILLITRLLDALWDPLLGIVIDRGFKRVGHQLVNYLALAGVLICCGFAALLQPQLLAHFIGWGSTELWIAIALLLTYICYSFISITYQSWAVLLGQGQLHQSQVASVREAMALMGVLVASVLSHLYGLWLNWWVFSSSLALGLFCWYRLHIQISKTPLIFTSQALPTHSLAWHWRSVGKELLEPFNDGFFRQLLGVYGVNGVASAIAATLFLFFVQDRLELGSKQASILLLLYFVSAAISMPFWLKRIQQVGLKNTWLIAMMIAVVAFVGSYFLSAGDMFWFSLICIGTGFALGADLTAPNAMLNTHIQKSLKAIAGKAQYLAWWNFVSKLNLALAAGLAFPLLALLSYTPFPEGSSFKNSEQGLMALTLAYSVLPCSLKVLAIVLLCRNKSFNT